MEVIFEIHVSMIRDIFPKKTKDKRNKSIEG